MSNKPSSCGCGVSEQINQHERRILIIVFILNAGMFIAEFGAGLWSGSTALLADSLDMLADALVYAIGLYALGRPQIWRNRAALVNGSLQLLLGLAIAVEAGFKIQAGTLPNFETMGVFAVLAFAVNTTSLVLLTRFREGDINLRSTWICSRNDMIANVGVMVAAGLVAYTQTAWPDIIIGLIIALIVVNSAIKIIKEAVNATG